MNGLIVGVGARPGVLAEDVVDLLRAVFDAHGVKPTLMAIPDFRTQEQGLYAAAQELSLSVIGVGASALHAVQAVCPTRSAKAEAATGFASVAEGCALAAAGEGARLMVRRQDGRGVTCAIAGQDDGEQA